MRFEISYEFKLSSTHPRPEIRHPRPEPLPPSPTIVHSLTISTPGQGLHAITHEIERVVLRAASTPADAHPALDSDSSGLCTIFIRHTSASLLIQENADPSARLDLEAWFHRLIPEHDELYTHTDEGPDDMPSHIKSALTQSNLSIPILHGRLALGRWQGIYLWEHRRAGADRTIIVHISP